ncbi:phosphate transport system regulatory protein PhoU [Halioglobus japonicus]|uniref:Phosphate-specific transport system accessory protein PhoU n=1 Tax=Halioglobus japonicus TaxID=930805 RepID=A0AAP8MFE9_9GAMM|nr:MULTISPECIES: phosphate signaling complex protein PhoU [Halioglobus]AQA18824.1 phosphate transport system regulatory protein PhoU [Halioglobus japonicus]KZX53324.1 transcriptional regulator PhoU [Halioglobus sp. HI00S01]PLW86858.1 phosphate transport system regulatory protein PhoU [Halioglobus japonicus]GHD23683.1 phosphate transport system regulatory protein PhoU [Halioglobus japonicus]
MLKQDDYKQHISEKFNTELEAIKNHLLEMGGKVEQQLSEAVEALVSRDTGEAETIVQRDHEVNEMEMAIDDECATILARRQPAASDLRLVVAVMKVNTDVERIGDEAAKIARQAIRLAEENISPSNYVEIRHIGSHVASMLRKSLDAFARLDLELAVEVVKEDRAVDKEYDSAMRALMTFMMEDPRDIGPILNEMWALRSLERIGDHAANIAEHVVYLVRGQDVRHRSLEDFIEQVGDI